MYDFSTMLTLVLYRSRVLAGDPIPEGDAIMVLSAVEHANNVEVALKHQGVWEWDDEHVSDWKLERIKKVAEMHALYDGDLAIPRPGARIGGVHPTFVAAGDYAFAWGSVGPLYLTASAAPRPRGRPKSKLTEEQKKVQRERLVAKWKEQGVTKELLAGLKRHHLLTLASSFGIHDPAFSGGSNDDLRKAIAKKAGAR